MSLRSMEVTHSHVWREVLIVSGLSILHFSVLRNLLRLLRSSIALDLLFDFRPTLLHFCSPADAMPPPGRDSITRYRSAYINTQSGESVCKSSGA